MNNNVENKVIVITGASSGMGEASARHLASMGSKVILGARRADRIEKLVSEIKSDGGEAIAITTDVTNKDDVKKLVDTAVKTYGHIDVLINNAGVMPLSMLESVNVDEWDQMIDVNIKGVLYGIAAALPHMTKQKFGHIINTASVAAHIIFPASAVYSATKFAVRAVTEGLRQEMTPHNIRTTLICPGAVTTELLDHISDKDVQSANQEYVGQVGIPAASYADMVAFAISQPEYVDVNELIFRPTAQAM